MRGGWWWMCGCSYPWMRNERAEVAIMSQIVTEGARGGGEAVVQC